MTPALAVVEHESGPVETLEAAETEIIHLREAGDIESLDEMQRNASAAALYMKSCGYAEMANRYAALKVRAVASIGAIDIALNPRVSKSDPPPLIIGDVEIGRGARDKWRLLGITERRGLLGPILTAIAATDEVTGKAAVAEAQRQGTAWIATKALRDRFLLLEARDGLSRYELARRVRADHRAVTRYTNPDHYSTCQRVRWLSALPVIEALGLDPLALPPAPPSTTSWKNRKARQRAAGEALKLVERDQAIKRAVRKHGGARAEAYAMAERMQDVLAQAQRETEDRDARRALSEAGVHYRRMRDEIVRALGVA